MKWILTFTQIVWLLYYLLSNAWVLSMSWCISNMSVSNNFVSSLDELAVIIRDHKLQVLVILEICWAILIQLSNLASYFTINCWRQQTHSALQFWSFWSRPSLLSSLIAHLGLFDCTFNILTYGALFPLVLNRHCWAEVKLLPHLIWFQYLGTVV